MCGRGAPGCRRDLEPEALGALAGERAGSACPLAVAQMLHQRGCGGGGIAGRVQAAELPLHDLRGPAAVRRDDRAARRHRLDEHESEWLAIGAVQQAPRPRQRLPRIGERPGELDPTGQVELRRSAAQRAEQLLALLADLVSGHHQPQPGELAGRERDRLQRQIGALPGDDRPEQQHHRRPRRQRRRRVGVEVDTRMCHEQPAAAPPRDEIGRHRLGHRDHAVGRPRGEPHDPRRGAGGQEVGVLEDQRWALVAPIERAQRRRAGDRAAHAPGHERARAHGAHECAYLGRMGEQPQGRAAASA